MKESELQTKIKERLTKHGWLVVKLEKTSWNGIPDLMCIRKGHVMFLEIKTENGVVSPLQDHRIKMLNDIGCFARVVRSIDDTDIFCYKNL
jgi:Holliday junction resolvase